MEEQNASPIPLQARVPYFRRFLYGYASYREDAEPILPKDHIFMTGWNRAKQDLTEGGSLN
jgi:hypothetical protein